MDHNLFVYNSLSRKKERFEPLESPFVGLYVCGPTVYGDTHIGHSRPAITFDLLFRYLKYLGYKVRYVRNITDVGHLQGDSDTGEDKILKKATVEQIEPMEVVQVYVNQYHEMLRLLNVLSPSIEPTASGHIIEQLQMIRKIVDKGYAYEKNGSVYFNVEKYNKDNHYGKLSGRVLEDLYSYTRDLDGQSEKESSFDFALWKKASPEHLMRWPSEWSEGFPGWHLECSVMSTKYLGEEFDIHGGGMDLLFPHHECEIAQSKAANGKDSVKYWMHNNMITINGQKMGKSLGNTVSLEQLFSGDNKLLSKAFSPMTIRFFSLQAHYRSTLDFSNDALVASEKGLQRLMTGIKTLNKLTPAKETSIEISGLEKKCFDALNDDLNSPILISHLFDGIRMINSVQDGKETIAADDLEKLKKLYNDFVFEILGLVDEQGEGGNSEVLGGVMDMVLKLRQEAKQRKDFETSDKIRDELTELGFLIKDRKDGADWELR